MQVSQRWYIIIYVQNEVSKVICHAVPSTYEIQNVCACCSTWYTEVPALAWLG
jgi:hypothetical protein